MKAIPHPQIKFNRKLLTVYIIYIVSGASILLFLLQGTLQEFNLWPFSYPEASFILFSFICGFALLRLLFSLPFLLKTLRRHPKRYSLSLPFYTIVLFVLTLFLSFFNFFNSFPGVDIYIGVVALLFGLAAFIGGISGIRSFRRKEWDHLEQVEKSNFTRIKNAARFVYWIYILSGSIILLSFLFPLLKEQKVWPPNIGLEWPFLNSTLIFLFGAVIFVLFYYLWFFLYTLRHYKTVPELLIPIVLLLVYFGFSFVFSGQMLYRISYLLYGFGALICGIWGLHEFRKDFGQPIASS